MSEDTRKETRPLCPSAQPDWPGSILIGVVGGTAGDPRVSNLVTSLPVTSEVLDLAGPVAPTEVFRFAAPCLCKGCAHFQEEDCTLVERVVGLLPPVTSALPHCDIRPDCRWWQQEGAAACRRCPQMVTKNYNPSETMVAAATPSTERLSQRST